jgi:hypothetical protein
LIQCPAPIFPPLPVSLSGFLLPFCEKAGKI